MFKLLQVSIVLSIGTLVTGQLPAQDWPEFRGPTAQGHATGKLPVRWSEKENVAWVVDLPGEGWSSPVIVAGKIYLTTAVKDEDKPTAQEEAAGENAPAKPKVKKSFSLRTLCLSAETGKLLWNTEVFHEPATAPNIHNKNSHASPTPIVKDGKIYVHFGHQGTGCLDLEGKVLWKNNDHPYKPVHGNGGSPCLTQDTLIFSIDGVDMQAVIGLDINTGKTRWKTDRGDKAITKPFSFGTPLVIEHEGVKQVICQGSDVVMSLDPYTGKELWRVRYKGYSQIPRPIYHDGLIYICTGYESPKLLAIKPGGTGDVTASNIVWTVVRSVPATPSPVIVGDAIYMVSDFSVMSCLDAKTGTQRWQGRLTGGFSASLIEADGKIYAMSEKGVCYVVEAGPAYKELSKNELPGRTLATPTPYGGRLFIRTDEKLFCIK